MLVHRNKIKTAAENSLNGLKSSRIRICEDAAIRLMDKYNSRYWNKRRNKQLSFEKAMIQAWHAQDLMWLYRHQELETRKFFNILNAVDTEYIELTKEDTVFVGKWCD